MKKIMNHSFLVVLSILWVVFDPSVFSGFILCLSLVNLIEEIVDKMAGVV